MTLYQSIALTALLSVFASCQVNSISSRSDSSRTPRLESESHRVYACRKIDSNEISVDGSLDEGVWQKALVMTNFVTAGAKPQKAKHHTRAFMLWSDTHLYWAFEAYIDDIRSKHTERDDPIFESEVAEVFLCPAGAESPYYEINFNPQNTCYDSLLFNWRYREQVKHGQTWAEKYNGNAQSQTKVHRDAKGKVTKWTLEVAVPFSDLNANGNSPPKPGDEWLFNAFRIAHGKGDKIEYTAWTSTKADFHRPYRFPRLVFAN